MLRFKQETLRDRIYACWVGKSIGGTLGTPYEGTRDMLDIQGFASAPGKPLPNDDLDLQLIWLRAVDQLGPEGVNSKTLGEYWLSFVMPHWNEYGVGKANMREGFLPPLSGAVNNEEWLHSNGAWIRTEIWACLYPGLPEKAIRYAFEDASVDHGYGEGTYAAIFVAAMESAAFVISDARQLLDIGLSKIPENCRVAQSVLLAVDAYDSGASWQEARKRLVEDSEDLGWFQAPANIGYVVIGLLYGEGDFKRSLILAVNCGDDTDCTGATLGSLLGIMNGMAGIPADWQAYIGDDIITYCLLNGHGGYPKTCTQLTDCIMNLLPVTLRTPNDVLINGGEPPAVLGGVDDYTGVTPESMKGRAFVESFASLTDYAYTVENVFVQATVAYNAEPIIAPQATLTGTLFLQQRIMPEQRHYRLRWLLPEGWTVQSSLNLFTPALHSPYKQHASTPFVITAGDTVAANNRVIVEITTVGRPTPLYVPMTILG